MREHLLALLCDQIDSGSTTIGIDIEGLATVGPRELAERIPRMLELRNGEIQTMVVGDMYGFNCGVREEMLQRSYRMDLRPLWFTAYGFEMLNKTGFKCRCSIGEFEQVRGLFERIGVSVESRRRPEFPDGRSNALEDYIAILVQCAVQDSPNA